MDGPTLKRANSAPHLDWPLSAEEKKGCVLRLYDKDVQAANELIRSSEEKLESLQMQLEELQPAAHTPLEKPSQPATSAPQSGRDSESARVVAAHASQVVELPETDDAAEKLRAAIATATAALQALENAKVKKDQPKIESESPRCSSGVQRARSEGPLVGILCKDPERRSRGSSLGGEKRRVSFGTVYDDDDTSPRNVEDTLATRISDSKHKDCAVKLEDSQAHANGVEPEPELFAPDWVGEAVAPNLHAKQAEKKLDPNVAPWRPSIPAATKEGSERWQRHVTKTLSEHQSSTECSASPEVSSKAPKGLPPRQRSSDRAAAATPMRQQRGSGASTPRRGQQAAAAAGTPKRTGRVWRPPART